MGKKGGRGEGGKKKTHSCAAKIGESKQIVKSIKILYKLIKIIADGQRNAEVSLQGEE